MFHAKETHFFNLHYDRGIDWYTDLFPAKNGEIAVGEGTPNYADGTPGLVSRIASHLPKAKLIYMVREPLSRLESHYVQEIDNGWKFDSLKDGINRLPSLVSSSDYWARLSEFREHYADENILVQYFEDFVESPQSVVETCCRFLAVDQPEADVAPEVQNTREEKAIDGALLRWLRNKSWYQRANWMLPRRLVRIVRPLLRRRVAVDVSWGGGLRESISSQLDQSTRRLLEYSDKPLNFWQS